MGSNPTIILVDLVFSEKEHAIFEKIQCFPGKCTCAACRQWGQEWDCTVAQDFISSVAKHSVVLLEAYQENSEWNSFWSHMCVSSENTCISFQWCYLTVTYGRKTLTSQCLLDKNKWYPQSTQCCLLSHSSIPSRTSVRTCHLYLRKALIQRNPILIILVSDLTVLEDLIRCPPHMLGEITYQQRLFSLANLKRFLSPFSQISRELKSVY